MAKNRRHDIVKPSKFKTSLCSFFQSEEGCPFGDTCAFAHGEADLRPEEEVVKPKPAATEEAAADGATKSADKVQGGAKKTNNSNNNKNNKPGNRQGNKNYAKAQGKEGAYDNSAAYSSYFAMNGGYYIPPGVGHEPYYNINAVHGVNTMNPLVFPTTYPSSSPHWFMENNANAAAMNGNDAMQNAYMNYYMNNGAYGSNMGGFLPYGEGDAAGYTGGSTADHAGKDRKKDAAAGHALRPTVPIVSSNTMVHINNVHHPVPSAAVDNSAILTNQFHDPVLAESNNRIKNISLPPNVVLLDGTANIPQNLTLQSLLSSDAPPTVVHIPLNANMQVNRDGRTGGAATSGYVPSFAGANPAADADSGNGVEAAGDYDNWSNVIEQLLREGKSSASIPASVTAAESTVSEERAAAEGGSDPSSQKVDLSSLLLNINTSHASGKPVVLSLKEPVPLIVGDEKKDGPRAGKAEANGTSTTAAAASKPPRKGLLCAVRRGDAPVPAPPAAVEPKPTEDQSPAEEKNARKTRAKVQLVSNHFKNYTKSDQTMEEVGEDGSCILLYYAEKNTILYITKPTLEADDEGKSASGEDEEGKEQEEKDGESTEEKKPTTARYPRKGVMPIRCRRPARPKKLISEGEANRDEETEYCI